MGDDERWWHRAKCAGEPTNLFYPPRDRRVYRGVADEAKAICWGTGEYDKACPSRLDCLLDAVDRNDPHGIWGGMSNRERRHLVRKHADEGQGTTFREWVARHYGTSKAQRLLEQDLGCDEDADETDRAS